MKAQNSVALVTGANRGLGLAFARGLLAAGARKVYAAARDPGSISIPGVVPIKLDVTRADEVEAAAKECGDVTLLINNAGIIRGGSLFAEGTVEGTRAELETNFFGTLALTRGFAPILAANGGGAIVNVLSVLSWVVLPGGAGYSASKAAAWALTNAARNELRAQATQVLALHVGYMDTDMTKGIEGPKSRPEDIVLRALAALEAGQDEVLADEISQQVKLGLSAERGVYLGNPAH
jgi:NAD(P)-dependent dehydrogenase (short-subunit alcohol dehydrogenase family)